MCSLNGNFKTKTGNHTCYDSYGFDFSLEPCITSVVFDCKNEEYADRQLKTAEYRQIDDICISLTHVVTVLNLRHQDVDINCEEREFKQAQNDCQSLLFKTIKLELLGVLVLKSFGVLEANHH